MLAQEPHSAEEIHLVRDAASGLDAVIVLHSTTLGPAAGGCRLWHYAQYGAAVADACRLAEGMSYKNALAELPLGGGKAVIARPSGQFDRPALLMAFGRAVQALGGRYLTAEDAGTSVSDMQWVARETSHVAGLPPRALRPGGDPSYWTALGVLSSMRVAAAQRLARPLADCTVAIQGVGHVGSALATMLKAEGVPLTIADTDAAAAARVAVATGAQVVPVSRIVSTDADILAPCALGGTLSHATVGAVRARVVCGAANNQLASPEDGERLADAGVLYAPDYVVNAGGIINVAAEYLGWTREEARRRVDGTATRLMTVLKHAAGSGLAPHAAADSLARAAIAAAPQPWRRATA